MIDWWTYIIIQHRFWDMPDLLLLLLAHVPSRRDASRLARTHSTVWLFSFHRIWSQTFYVPWNLPRPEASGVRLSSPDLSLSYDSDDCAQEVSDVAFKAFQRRSRYVKSIVLDLRDLQRDHHLDAAPYDHHPFPRLTSLNVTLGSHDTLLNRFLLPTLTTIDLTMAPFPPSALSNVPSVVAAASTLVDLERFFLTGSTPQGASDPKAPWLMEFLDKLPNSCQLTGLGVQGCSLPSAFLRFLFNLHNLTALRLSLHAFDKSDGMLEADVLLAIQSVDLNELALWLTPSCPFNMTSVLHFPGLIELHLIIAGSIPPLYFDYLARLSQLQRIYVQCTDMGVLLTNDVFKAFVDGWPFIEEITLQDIAHYQPSWTPDIRLRIESLGMLARPGTRLRSIEVDVDATGDRPLAPPRETLSPTVSVRVFFPSLNSAPLYAFEYLEELCGRPGDEMEEEVGWVWMGLLEEEA